MPGTRGTRPGASWERLYLEVRARKRVLLEERAREVRRGRVVGEDPPLANPAAVLWGAGGGSDERRGDGAGRGGAREGSTSGRGVVRALLSGELWHWAGRLCNCWRCRGYIAALYVRSVCRVFAGI